MMKKVFASLFIFLFTSSLVVAIPTILSINGQMKKDGAFLNGHYDMEFSILDSTAKVLWTEKYDQVLLLNGVFKVNLGQKIPIDKAAIQNGIKMSIKVADQITYRDLATVPYSTISDYSNLAKEVDWSGVKNKPSVSDLNGQILSAQIPDSLVSNRMIATIDAKKIIGDLPRSSAFVDDISGTDVQFKIQNLNQNNETGSKVLLSSDKDRILGFLRAYKDVKGNRKLELGSGTDAPVVFSRNGVSYLTLDSNMAQLGSGVSLSGDGSGLTNLNASAIRGTIQATIATQSITNDHIRRDTKIDFSKLNIAKTDLITLGLSDYYPRTNSITNDMLAPGIDGSKIVGSIQATLPPQTITNDHIRRDTKIDFSKLNIAKSDLVGLGMQSQDMRMSQSDFHNYATTENLAYFYNSKNVTSGSNQFTIRNESINNATGSKVFLSSDSDSIQGSVSAYKDAQGNKLFGLGSETDTDVVLSRNKSSYLTLSKSGSSGVITLSNGVSMSGDGSGLLNLTAANLKGAVPSGSIQPNSISNDKISSLDGSKIIGQIPAPKLTGYIPPASIQSGSISNDMLASGIDGAKILTGTITNDKIRPDTKIDFSKLNIAKADLVALGLQTQDAKLSQSDFHNYSITETLLYPTNSKNTASGYNQFTFRNESINNSTGTKITLSSDNDGILGYFSTSKDTLGNRAVNIGSDTDTDITIQRNKTPFLTLTKNGNNGTVSLSSGVSISGDGSGLINLTAANLKGAIPSGSIQPNSISNDKISSLDGSKLIGLIPAPKLAGYIPPTSIQSNSISNDMLATGIDGAKILAGSITNDKLKFDSKIDFSKLNIAKSDLLTLGLSDYYPKTNSITNDLIATGIDGAKILVGSISNDKIRSDVKIDFAKLNIAKADLVGLGMQSQDMKMSQLDFHGYAINESLLYSTNSKNTPSGFNQYIFKNESINNSTGSKITLSSDNDGILGYFSTSKDTLGNKSVLIGSDTDTDIAIQRNKSTFLTFTKSGNNGAIVLNSGVSLSGDGSGLTNITADNLKGTVPSATIQVNSISSEKISSLDGNKITGQISASKLSGYISPASIPLSSISNDMLASGIDGSKFMAGTITNDKIKSDTKIDFSKLNIAKSDLLTLGLSDYYPRTNSITNDLIATGIDGAKILVGTITNDKIRSDTKIDFAKLNIAKTDLIGLGMQSQDMKMSQTDFHTYAITETLLYPTNSKNTASGYNQFVFRNESINNSTGTKLSFSSDNDGVQGYLSTYKDSSGSKSVNIGSDTDNDLTLQRNKTTLITLTKSGANGTVALSSGVTISGDGSGLTNLTGANIKGTIPSSSIQSNSIANDRIISLDGSKLIGQIFASKLIGYVPASSIQSGSISSDMLGSNIDGAKFLVGSIANDKIRPDTKIDFSKLNIAKSDLIGLGMQSQDMKLAQSDFHNYAVTETLLYPINSKNTAVGFNQFIFRNESINNNTGAKITLSAENDGVQGYVSTSKDSLGNKTVNFGSDTDTDLTLQRNKTTLVTLTKNGSNGIVALSSGVSISGDGSGLTNLTATNLKGTLPSGSISVNSISNDRIISLDGSKIIGQIATSKLSGYISPSSIQSGSISSDMLSSNIDGAKFLVGSIANDKIRSDTKIDFSKLNIAKADLVSLGMQSQDMKMSQLDFHSYAINESLLYPINSKNTAVGFNQFVFRNESINNNTGAKITVSAENDGVQGYVSTSKDTSGVKTVNFGSDTDTDLTFQRNKSTLVTLTKNGINGTVALSSGVTISGDGSGLTNLSGANIKGAIPSSSIQSNAITSDKIVSLDGNKIIGQIAASKLTGFVPPSSIQTGSISSDMLGANIDGAKFLVGSIANDKIRSDTKIDFAKLNIAKTDLVGLGMQSQDMKMSQSDFHTYAITETLLYPTNSKSTPSGYNQFIFRNESINNSTGTKLSFSSDNDGIQGYMSTYKDSSGSKSVNIGSDTDNDLTLQRNKTTLLTLTKSGSNGTVALSNGVIISGDGSGLTNLTADNLKGTLPVATIQSGSIVSDKIANLDGNKLIGQVATSKLSGFIPSSLIQAGTISNNMLASGIDGAKFLVGSIANDKIRPDTKIDFSKLNIAKSDLISLGMQSQDMKLAQSDFHNYAVTETLLYPINSKNTAVGFNQFIFRNESINNNTGAKITLSAENDGVQGYVSTSKDTSGIKTVNFGSDTDTDLTLQRNKTTFATLTKNGSNGIVALSSGVSISGDGSGLTNLTADNLKGTLPVATIQSGSIVSDKIANLDGSKLIGQVSATKLTGFVPPSSIQSSSISNDMLATGIDGAKVTVGTITNDKLKFDSKIDFSKLNIAKADLVGIGMQSQDMKMSQSDFHNYSATENLVYFYNSKNIASGYNLFTVRNASINNSTGSKLLFSSDNDGVQGYVSTSKDTSGIRTVNFGSDTDSDVTLQRNKSTLVTLTKNGTNGTVALSSGVTISGDGSGLTNLTADNLKGTLPVSTLQSGSIVSDKIANLDGSKIIGQVATSKLSGYISPSSIQSGSISSDMLGTNIDGAKFLLGSIANDKIRSDTKIDFSKLNIAKTDLVGLGMQSQDMKMSQSDFHNYAITETLLYPTNSKSTPSGYNQFIFRNESINNSTGTKLTFSSDNDGVQGYVSTYKDSSGSKSVNIGSDTDNDLTLQRNKTTLLTLTKTGSTGTVALSSGVTISGDGSGLTNLTADNLKGTLPVATIQSGSIVSDKIANLDGSKIIGQVATSKLSGYISGTLIQSGSISSDMLASGIDGAKIGTGINASNITTGTFTEDKLASLSWGKVSKSGSSLGDLANRDASFLTGTVSDSALSSNISKLGQTIENTEITSVDWSKITSKPSIAYASTIPADQLNQTEITNIKAGKSATGTTFGTMASQDASNVTIVSGKANLTELTVGKITITGAQETSTSNVATKPRDENGVVISGIQPPLIKSSYINLVQYSNQTITLPIKSTDTVLSLSVILKRDDGTIYSISSSGGSLGGVNMDLILFDYVATVQNGFYQVTIKTVASYDTLSQIPGLNHLKATIRTDYIKN